MAGFPATAGNRVGGVRSGFRVTRDPGFEETWLSGTRNSWGSQFRREPELIVISDAELILKPSLGKTTSGNLFQNEPEMRVFGGSELILTQATRHF
jgi:hypothetical protein